MEWELLVSSSLGNENHCEYSVMAAMGSALHYQEDKISRSVHMEDEKAGLR